MSENEFKLLLNYRSTWRLVSAMAETEYKFSLHFLVYPSLSKRSVLILDLVILQRKTIQKRSDPAYFSVLSIASYLFGSYTEPI